MLSALWVVLALFAFRPGYAPAPGVERAAMAHLESCARGYLGARLERAQHIVYRPWADSARRAYVALPDTVYIHPAWRADTWTVAHEMLHVAVGRPGHPQQIFMACGLWRPE